MYYYDRKIIFDLYLFSTSHNLLLFRRHWHESPPRLPAGHTALCGFDQEDKVRCLAAVLCHNLLSGTSSPSTMWPSPARLWRRRTVRRPSEGETIEICESYLTWVSQVRGEGHRPVRPWEESYLWSRLATLPSSLSKELNFPLAYVITTYMDVRNLGQWTGLTHSTDPVQS